MAKVTGQNIPPQLATQARRLLTVKIAKAGRSASCAQRKGAMLRKSKKPQPSEANAFLPAAEYVAAMMNPELSDRERAPIVRAIVAQLKRGIFDERFWFDAPSEQKDILTAIPSSIADANPPPYEYRDPQNMPTIPTYGQGTVGGTAMQYMGSRDGTLFKDLSMSWARLIFDLGGIEAGRKALFAYLIVNGEIEVRASHRGSRPMLSVITSAAVVSADDPALQTTSPVTEGVAVSAPTQTRKTQSHYWRYRLPRTSPPYFQRTQLREIVRSVEKMATRDSAQQPEKALVLLAPRPMFGRGYNNNTSVTSTLNATASIKAIMASSTVSFEAWTGVPDGWLWNIPMMRVGFIDVAGKTASHWYEYLIDAPPRHFIQSANWVRMAGYNFRASFTRFEYEFDQWGSPTVIRTKFELMNGKIIRHPATGRTREYYEYDFVENIDNMLYFNSNTPLKVTRRRTYKAGITVNLSTRTSTAGAENVTAEMIHTRLYFREVFVPA